MPDLRCDRESLGLLLEQITEMVNIEAPGLCRVSEYIVSNRFVAVCPRYLLFCFIYMLVGLDHI